MSYVTKWVLLLRNDDDWILDHTEEELVRLLEGALCTLGRYGLQLHNAAAVDVGPKAMSGGVWVGTTNYGSASDAREMLEDGPPWLAFVLLLAQDQDREWVQVWPPAGGLK